MCENLHFHREIMLPVCFNLIILYEIEVCLKNSVLLIGLFSFRALLMLALVSGIADFILTCFLFLEQIMVGVVDKYYNWELEAFSF